MARKASSLRGRVVSRAAVLAVFGGLAGVAMDRHDAWSAHLGVAVEGNESIGAGALLGAAIGSLAGMVGGDRRGGHADPFHDAPGGDADGGDGGD